MVCKIDITWAFYVALVVKKPPANAGDSGVVGSIPGWGRSPGKGNGDPLLDSCLENYGQRSLAGPSPWICRLRHDRRDLAGMRKKSV